MRDGRHIVWLSSPAAYDKVCMTESTLTPGETCILSRQRLALIVVDEEDQSVPLIYPDVCRWLLQVLLERHFSSVVNGEYSP